MYSLDEVLKFAEHCKNLKLRSSFIFLKIYLGQSFILQLWHLVVMKNDKFLYKQPMVILIFSCPAVAHITIPTQIPPCYFVLGLDVQF